MKPTWEQALIAPDATYRDALKAIDFTGTGMALIVDGDRRLLGVLSDGDLRRALIRGAGLEEPALLGATREPLCIDQQQDKAATLAMLRAHSLRQLPILDSHRRVVGLSTISDFLNIPVRANPVVIMAGGKGVRLAELTRDTPKPMLKVGPRPILDTIVGSFAAQGFRRFWLAVNYKADQIERHFGDGTQLGLDIRYLREQQPLGTCGALSLLPTQDQSIVVTNGDLLTQVDYGHVLDGHVESGAAATVVVRDYQVQVPFGVIDAKEGRVLGIEEKPIRTYVISAGAYVLSPLALSIIPQDAQFDMPSLLTAMLEAGMTVRQQHADGYWMDIGRPPDYVQANKDFSTIFNS